MTNCILNPQRRGHISTSLLLILCLFMLTDVHADRDDPYLEFDDTMLEEALVYPDWFKLSMGDLNEDIKEAARAGKSGILVYFGQKRCAYCEQFLKENLGAADIEHYIREYYDIIPIDIWGIEDIVDTNGETYTERELSIRYKTNFTPSLVFYDLDGKPVFRLRGYYPPYKFRAALQYVTEGFYKNETFKEYLDRAEPGTFFLLEGLNERDFFAEPPYDLDRSSKPATKHLAVFFEQGDCHACDLLHSGPLSEQEALDEINKMEAVQLNMWSDTPVITPDGRKTTAREWAEELNLFYSPTIIFFDYNGKEIIRIDSVVQYYRLWGVLDYVNKKAYLTEPDYQGWRLKQRETGNSK
ncbi:MAG: thioredoxin fold domain-containing protein [Gammaproteobacteria bacterium]|jgi:thioredoxin-related protein